MKPLKITNKGSLNSALATLQHELIEVAPPYNTITDKSGKNRVFYLKVFTEQQLKTSNQNNAFHLLLQAFWESNCSSFLDYDSLREHYKRLAGLIELKKIVNIKQETKSMLYKAIKLLPLDEKEKQVIYSLLKGEVETHKSWSEVKKDKATFAIQELRNDCITSGAYAGNNKVKSIIDEMDKNDWLNYDVRFSDEF